MTKTPSKFGKVINFEGINFSNLYYTVAGKHNEKSNETVLVFWQIYSKTLKSLHGRMHKKSFMCVLTCGQVLVCVCCELYVEHTYNI